MGFLGSMAGPFVSSGVPLGDTLWSGPLVLWVSLGDQAATRWEPDGDQLGPSGDHMRSSGDEIGPSGSKSDQVETKWGPSGDQMGPSGDRMGNEWGPSGDQQREC